MRFQVEESMFPEEVNAALDFPKESLYAALHDGLGMPIGLHIVGNSIAVALPLLRQAGTPGALATSNLARNESTEQSFLACMAR